MIEEARRAKSELYELTETLEKYLAKAYIRTLEEINHSLKIKIKRTTVVQSTPVKINRKALRQCLWRNKKTFSTQSEINVTAKVYSQTYKYVKTIKHDEVSNENYIEKKKCYALYFKKQA